MTREQYESLQLKELREIAKSRKLKGTTAMRKEQLINRMLEEDAKESAKSEVSAAESSGAEAPEADHTRSGPSRTGSSKTGSSRADSSKAEFQRTEAAKNSYSRNEGGSRRSSSRGNDNDSGTRRDFRHNESHERQNGYERQNNGERQSGYERQNNGERQNGYERQNNGERQNGYERQNNGERQNGYERQNNGERQNGYEHQNSDEHQNDGFDENEQMRQELGQLDSGSEAHGILEVMSDGYGFIRSENFLPGDDDVYVSPSQIRKFHLKTGDVLSGNTRIKSQNEKFSALLFVKSVNGLDPYVNARRMNFEDMTPIFPNERIHLERPGGPVAMRIVDLVSPIGKGQRGMIVSPPKAGKTTLLKEAAKSILRNNPEMHVIILLIDERPEEVTDIRETVRGKNVEVIYSTFDELPEHHKRVSEMVIERAKRLVENKQDVIIFIDSITRLARAYNQVVPPSGRTLSGGLDPAALHMPKRFFGAARNMREGGSLTILATALVDTGSKMDDVVYEEFKGTGNMELILDRKLQERRVFPAIDLARSGTRREDLLLDSDELEAVNNMRRALNGLRAEEAGENVLNMFTHTRNNRELVQMLKKQRIV
ncbi:transcription termination factor Rho [Bilifractor sp. LCP19S3_H10]|uniref:transcription termination factor Rho n=1 Tax=Bilifractor sp. LCP19S3_H10 TaxID=3438736 RepID=UPI003F918F00